MKLWVKLSILLILVINLIIEIGVRTVNPQVHNFSVNLAGEKLKSIAISIAASVDGDEFKNVDIFDSTSVYSSSYQHITKTIQQAKENFELTSDNYSISILDKNSLAFGIVLNKSSVGKDSLQKLSSFSKNAAIEVFETKRCTYTPIYKDRYGSWLSGLAPIMDSLRNVIGVIVVNQKYSAVQAKIDEINNFIFYGRLTLIPITVLVSIVLAHIFLLPVNKVKQKIVKLAKGDYSNSENIKSGGEIKELVKAASDLRNTLLEQQQKIFKTINELETAKNAAEASDRMKSEFLSLISHEVRTPLNIILGNLGIVSYELKDKENKELEGIFSSIKKGSERLIRTVEMMVLYSELISGSYDKNIKVINTHDILCQIGVDFKSKHLNENVQLKLDCSANTVLFKTDQLLFEEAIKQILDNALKFTNSGTVSLSMVNKEDGICIIVEDTGIGISDEFFPELFKPFRQEDMSTTRPYDGNGLGLALAKKCCDINGIDLKIESEKNKGTKVEIKIGKDWLFN